MTNPNPFVPKGSLLDQQSVRRSRLKLAVFCVVAVSSVGLVAMLIQGCKREQPSDGNPPDTSTNLVSTDTNTTPIVDTNAMVLPPSTNTMPAYVPPPIVAVPPPVVDTSITVYEVAQGDTLGKIAKAHHVSLKELEAANAGVDPKRLKVKQKINIPAPSAMNPTSSAPTTDVAAGDTYAVKSGDTLSKIAKANGTTVKALEAANPGVDPNHLKVKQKLNLPGKADATVAPAPAPAPVYTPPAAPATPPTTTPTK
ncbi:MAG TPA: LysM domain-containing protein [Candidatus Sulfotelmatobacter sp.]|jgi:LysM repeat protein|nr:LysM domain-containing protein [Candidatus Sulfotelmatobacter sp.]